MQVEFSGDELILALVSMVRAIDPRMLQRGAEGFEVDFQTLDAKSEFSADERLLLKLRAALEAPATPGYYGVELEVGEGRRLGQTLEQLELLQPWPPDVLELSSSLRTRLTSVN
jgi:hypothetical protein